MVGEILKQAREAKCLTQRDIAQNTNLLLQVVVDLENDDFRRIPAAIYGRGFIKLYAEYVGLPPDQVDKLLQTFKQQYDGAHAPPVRTRQVPQQPSKVLRRPVSVPEKKEEEKANLEEEVHEYKAPPVSVPETSVAQHESVIPPPPREKVTPVQDVAPVSVPPKVSPMIEVEQPLTPKPEPAPVPDKKKPSPSMDDDGLLPLFAALHEHETKDTPTPEPVETPVEEPAPIPVKPAVSVVPVQVKEDFAGPVVPPESQTETDDGDDLFSMAKRLTQLRNGTASDPAPVLPEESAPVSSRPKPVVTMQPEPAKIVLPQTHDEEATPPAEPEKEQEKEVKAPFVLTMKRAVRISLDRITQAAHRSLDASSRAIQPAKSFFAGRGKMALLCGTGAVVLLLLIFGIHYLFQVTEQRMIEQETTTSLPPPELYLD